MDRSHSEADDGPNRRFPPRTQEPFWLYNPITEEFSREPSATERRALEVRKPPARSQATMPRTRWGRLVYRLFTLGWICPILLGGLAVLTLIAGLLEFRGAVTR